MILYNLLKYIQNKLTTDGQDAALIAALTVNGFGAYLNKNQAAINDTGGIPQHQIDRVDKTFQIVVKHESMNICASWSNILFESVRNFFHMLLPENTVDGIVYPAVMAWQISPIQAPSYIGTDDSGAHLYSFNIVVVIS